jgi:hypothetical protein
MNARFNNQLVNGIGTGMTSIRSNKYPVIRVGRKQENAAVRMGLAINYATIKFKV